MMGHSRLAWRFAALTCVLAAAACDGLEGTAIGPASSSLGVASAHPLFGPSWMTPDVSNADLLYISDGNGEVTVYRYWRHTLAGILTGFSQPMGECVDKHNDVWVTDYAAAQIVEYAHGGSKPMRKLNTGSDSPYACSVDFITGNLAVAEVKTGSSKQGDIAIYANASGQPTYFGDPNVSKFYGLAYDSGGNLLGAGQAGRYSGFAWLPRGGSRLIDLNVPGPDPSWNWYDVTGVQWDGRYFTLDYDDQLYQVSVFKGQAFYVGYVYLDYCCSGLGAFWIYNANPSQQGTQLVAAATQDSVVEYWQYPAGGNAFAYISHGIDQPTGLTISLKKK
jgi:hypothetical protein